MTDNPNETRPNAKYKLSKEKSINEENLTFYYNREHRLSKAPENVKKLYEQPLHKFNLLKPLISGKAMSAIFFSIIIFCVIIIMLSLTGYFDKSYLLDGNKLEISATIIDDVSLIVIKKTINKKDPYTGEVIIGISSVQEGEDFPIYPHKIYFSLKEEERYSLTAPFNSPKLAMVFQTEKSELKISVSTE